MVGSRVLDAFPREVLAAQNTHKKRYKLLRWCELRIRERVCPVIEKYGQQIEEWEAQARIRTGLRPRVRYVAPAPVSETTAEAIYYRFIEPYRVGIPARRRPTIAEQENRRTQTVDRYSFGIYSGKYSY